VGIDRGPEAAGRFFALAKRSPFCDSGAMKWMLYIVAFIALVIGVTFLIGYALPARTTISRSINLQQTPEAVFAVLADVQRMAEWNRNTEKVEMLPSVGGNQAIVQRWNRDDHHCGGERAAAPSRAQAGR
jgi:ABC-type protease/lipase transport system fused ATPase/permease subunit